MNRHRRDLFSALSFFHHPSVHCLCAPRVCTLSSHSHSSCCTSSPPSLRLRLRLRQCDQPCNTHAREQQPEHPPPCASRISRDDPHRRPSPPTRPPTRAPRVQRQHPMLPVQPAQPPPPPPPRLARPPRPSTSAARSPRAAASTWTCRRRLRRTRASSTQ